MTSTLQTIDQNTLARLVDAGAVHGASIIGQPGGWGVVIQYGKTERALAAKRGAVRNFARFETLVGYLKKLGIAKYQVDATQYDPATVKNERFRDDAAERMRHAHEAAAHDKWFRAQVEQALHEADDPTTVWLSNEEVKAHSAARRAEWLKRAGSEV
jgi:NADPH-dependent glutamate synthase beta subunit-like oxidoreductase